MQLVCHRDSYAIYRSYVQCRGYLVYNKQTRVLSSVKEKRVREKLALVNA